MADGNVPSRHWRRWAGLWMRLAGHGRLGRLAMRVAALGGPPYRARSFLAKLNPAGFIAATATLYHPRLRFGRHVYVGEGVVLYHGGGGGSIELGDRVHIYDHACLETSAGGVLTIGTDTSIHMRSQLMAHVGSIRIGNEVAIAQGCALYPYDHGIAPGSSIRSQPMVSRGDIVIEDDAWLGAHVVVLSGVRIGRGAVITAGSLVTRDVPANVIAGGVPARVLWNRTEVAGPAVPAAKSA
jgi:acetyltransferase-like isoleucine patch superfamily enzyme